MTRIDEQTPIRERWTAQPPGSGDEEIAGALLRVAAEPRPIGEKKLAEIHARLRSNARARSRAYARPTRPLLRQVLVATGLVLLGGTLSASVLHVLHTASLRAADSAARASLPKGKPNGRSFANAEQAAETAVPAETPDPVPEAQAVVDPPRAPRRDAVRETRGLRATAQDSLTPKRALALAPPSGSSQLAQESRLLASAISKLRRDGEPEQALAVLDRLGAEFGSGALAQEATATRIEALLRLGRNAQALELLDGQTLSGKGVGREMLVARAELRADKGRYSTALRDFDQLLSVRGQTDSVTERARYGRATCRAKIGDWDGARGDFQQYLDDFPQGRFADHARAALAPRSR